MKMMIRIIVTVALVGVLGWQLVGQSILNERRLLGTWELIIEDLDFEKIRKVRNKHRDDLDVGDRLGSAIEQAALTFVSDLLVDFEIRFTFLKDHTAELNIFILGEHEKEYLEWKITNKRELILRDKDDNYFDMDDVWVLENGKLVSKEKHNTDSNEGDVYLVKVNGD